MAVGFAFPWRRNEKINQYYIKPDSRIRSHDNWCLFFTHIFQISGYSILEKWSPEVGIQKIPLFDEAREWSEPFFPWFSKEKKTSLHNGSYEHRVPKIKQQNTLMYKYQVRLCMCDFLCVLCVWLNIVIGHLGRPHSTDTAPMTVLTGSVHAHILRKPSRAGSAVIRLALIEPSAATCV